MIYQTTITQKGQITIPKIVRDALKLAPAQKVSIRLTEDKKTAVIEPTDDFITLAKNISIKKKIDPVKARNSLEKSYARF